MKKGFFFKVSAVVCVLTNESPPLFVSSQTIEGQIGKLKFKKKNEKRFFL
jgi:hypothetical protein